MDAETLKVVAQVAGIGGIALAVLLMVFREVIQKNVFSSLSQEESYRLLRLMIVSTVGVAILGVGAWIYTKTQGPPTVDAAGTVIKEFAVSGLITDADNNGLGDVDVFMVGADDHARTNDSGAFRLKIKAAENSIVNVRVAKQGYKARTENVKLPTSGLIVALTATAPAVPASQTNSGGGGGDAPPRADVSRPTRDGGGSSSDRPRDPPPSKTGRVYIRYTGDVFGCNLFLTFRLGDRTVSPVGQNFPVNDIPLGEAEYVVGGTIACASTGGACTAAGSGRLTLQNEHIYDVVWTPNYPTCPVRLVQLP